MQGAVEDQIMALSEKEQTLEVQAEISALKSLLDELSPIGADEWIAENRPHWNRFEEEITDKKKFMNSPDDDPMMQEARKYKTAEEFVKAQLEDNVKDHIGIPKEKGLTKVAFYPEQIKTRQQLIDIWNDANKKDVIREIDSDDGVNRRKSKESQKQIDLLSPEEIDKTANANYASNEDEYKKSYETYDKYQEALKEAIEKAYQAGESISGRGGRSGNFRSVRSYALKRIARWLKGRHFVPPKGLVARSSR